MVRNNIENFNTIRNAIENNKLVLFIGSGVSYDSKLPSWKDLINSLKGSIESSNLDDYLKIAEYFYLQYGRHKYYSKINEFFPSNAETNDLHKLILTLKPQHIVTTNWDNLLEKAISRTGDLFFPVATDHDLASSPSAKLLVKMHGDIKHRNIVFKESDYLSYSDNFPLIENFVKSLFSTHIVVFIGYSISDYNLNLILNWIRNRTSDAPPTFTISSGEDKSHSDINYLYNKGVYLLADELNDHEIQSLKKEYPKLSDKSLMVVKIIKDITSTYEINNISEFFESLVNDLSSWRIVYPSQLVKLIKNRLRIVQVNKIYYDPGKSLIFYNFYSDKTKNIFKYRKVIRSLKKILVSMPIKGIYFVIDSYMGRGFILKNRNEFSIINEYSEFNYEKILDRLNKTSVLIEDKIIGDRLDDFYQIAFDAYYIKQLDKSRAIYLDLVRIYFTRQDFVKALLCAFNKKSVYQGEIPHDFWLSSSDEIMGENLSINDNISELISKFPNSLISRQSSLFQCLDANNTFLLQIYYEISNIHNEIENRIDVVSRGGKFFGNDLNTSEKKLFYTLRCLILFSLNNRITLLFNSYFKMICELSFRAILRSRINITHSINTIEIELAYVAISIFESEKISKFMYENLKDLENGIMFDDETFSYVLRVMDNLIKFLDKSDSRQLQLDGIRIWSNSLILLSYSLHNAVRLEEINKRLIVSLDNSYSHRLTKWINQFIVVQIKFYRGDFPGNKLLEILRKIIRSYNQQDTLCWPWDERLSSNILSIFDPNTSELSNIISEIDNDSHIKYFLDRIENTEENLIRIRYINDFVFGLYLLPTKKVKEKCKAIVIETYNKAIDDISRQINESDASFNTRSSIYDGMVFCLDVYRFNLLEDNHNELERILALLKTIVNQDYQSSYLSSIYITLDFQISEISDDILQRFNDMVDKIRTLKEKFESGWL